MEYFALGRHCCLWCLIAHNDMKVPLSERGRSQYRSLKVIKSDLHSFLTEGRGDLKKAKFFNNAISEHFFDIDIEEVHHAY